MNQNLLQNLRTNRPVRDGARVAMALSLLLPALLPGSRLAAGPSTGGQFTLVGGVVSGGGAASGGTFTLESTAGLPNAAVSSGGAFVITGGLIGVYVVPGDIELSLARTDDGLVRLSWPASAEGYVLEFTAQVGDGAGWTRVTPAPTANALLVPFDQPARFYRLRKP